MLTYLPGIPYQQGPRVSPSGLYRVGEFLARLNHALAGFSHPAAGHFMPWDSTNGLLFKRQLRDLLPAEVQTLVAPALQRLEHEVFPQLPRLRSQVIHHDGHGANLLRASEASEQVVGIIDFGDMIYGPIICDLAVSLTDFMEAHYDPAAVAAAMCRGFHSVLPLQATETDLLLDLVIARQILILQLFEFRRRNMETPAAVRDCGTTGYHCQSEHADGPGPCSIQPWPAGAADMNRSQAATADAELLQRRARAMGPTYELFYREPVQLVRGEGVWLYDAAGKPYLDCYNNVASVGHCHPKVVKALSEQAATLNTHTRYLHENVVRFAERLGASLPGELNVCMFVCTGTEANDLAFRIARAVTGNAGAIVTDDAYHGNSMVVTELSTADYPAAERPDYLAAIEAPNPYRGAFRYGEAELGSKYAAFAGKAIASLEQRGHKPAMILSDAIFDSNGVLTAPEGYFQVVYDQVRAAGGLCVADEVQSGLCRLGDHMWGFEDSGVVPDIVTMGKPIGNGHPLAAVVTTPAIAAAFARNSQYFNTFGGNPVSTAVGLAVLDVVEQEGILQNANTVGAYLGKRLRALADEYPLIGDVRGKGLFFGLECVRDRNSLEPAPEEAGRISDQLRANGVLVGICGPLDNVIKIRPPLVFAREHADLLLEKLGLALRSL